MKKVCTILFMLIFWLQLTSLVSADDRLQMVAKKTNQSPKLDGVITQEEWGEPTAVFAKDSENVRFMYGRVDDSRLPTEAELYTTWDDDYLYIGVVVASSTHQNNTGYRYCWQEDSIFLTIGLAANQEASYRMAFALADNGNLPLGYILSMPNKTLSGMDSDMEILLSYKEYYIARANGKTTYEVKLAWSDYTVDKRKIEDGFQFYLNMSLVTKSNEAGNPSWMMYGTFGDSVNKTNWQYPQIKLSKQEAVPGISKTQTQNPTQKTTPPSSSSSSSSASQSPPTSTPAQTNKLSPTGNGNGSPDPSASSKNTAAVSSTPGSTKGGSSGTNFWWFLLLPIPLAAIAAAVYMIIKKRKHTVA